MKLKKVLTIATLGVVLASCGGTSDPAKNLPEITKDDFKKGMKGAGEYQEANDYNTFRLTLKGTYAESSAKAVFEVDFDNLYCHLSLDIGENYANVTAYKDEEGAVLATDVKIYPIDKETGDFNYDVTPTTVSNYQEFDLKIGELAYKAAFDDIIANMPNEQTLLGTDIDTFVANIDVGIETGEELKFVGNESKDMFGVISTLTVSNKDGSLWTESSIVFKNKRLHSMGTTVKVNDEVSTSALMKLDYNTKVKLVKPSNPKK